MSNIPLAEEYVRIARRMLAKAAKLLPRKKKVRRAPRTSTKVTPSLRRKIYLYTASHPDVPYRKIADKFNVDGGRVSEIMHNVKGNGRAGKES